MNAKESEYYDTPLFDERTDKRQDEREERRQQRKENKRRERRKERISRRKKHKGSEEPLRATTTPTYDMSEGKRLRSKDLFFDLGNGLAMTAEGDRERGRERDTFTCVCNDCPHSNTCVADLYCAAISHMQDNQQFTTYSCLNHTGKIMDLAYCEGGNEEKSQQNTLRTLCCAGHMCNDVPPPGIPSTTTHKSIDTRSSADQAYIMPGAAIYLLVPAILLVILLIVTVIFLWKKKESSMRRRTEKKRIEKYLGDSLSAQPLAEDSSFSDPTSGSGSGKPRLIQRTVAQSVKLGAQIGNGKYGSVYRGRYQGGYVAVKIFMSKDTRSWEREYGIYNKLLLRHDNILGYLASDVISCDSVTKLWLICHYHENGSLYDYLNHPYNAVNLSQALSMLQTAAAGLVHLHTEIYGTQQTKPAIAHRDIKSKNILVKDDGTCCIADLGLAVIENYDSDNGELNTNKVGTKRYMSPELLSETMNFMDFESYKRADVYSFSLVMWETIQCTIFDGRADKYLMPFEGQVNNDPSFEEMRYVVAVQKSRPRIPTHWSSNKLYKQISKLIKECWNGTPTARLTILRLRKTLGTLYEDSRDCKHYV